MTDHLPECGYGIELSFDGVVQPAEPCICDRLRACESRVREDLLVETRRDVYDRGYATALDAARDAVAAIEGDNPGLLPRWVKRDALAAIDALKEKS